MAEVAAESSTYQAAGAAATLPPPRVVAAAARRGWELRYAASLVVNDAAVGMTASMSALLLRPGAAPGHLSHRAYLWLSGLFPLMWLLALALNRCYDARHLFVGTEEYHRLFRAALGLTAFIAITSFAVDARFARGHVIVAMPVALLLGVVVRFLVRQRLHAGWARGERLRRVLLVGHADSVVDLSWQLRRERYHGMGVVGACLPEGARGAGTPGYPPVVGAFDTVADAVRVACADTVLVLSCPELSGPALRRLAWQLERDNIDLIVSASLLDVAGDRTTIRPVDGMSLLHVEHPRLGGFRRVVKECADNGLALGLLLLAALPMAVLALLIRFEPGARGPALFRQVRVGRDGREFVMYKFRSMVVDAEQRLSALAGRNDHDGALFKVHDDPRVTRVGRWLRRLSLDELPQLFNVVLGDMSLVGPRPPLPAEVANYPADMLRRLVVKPGMTGLWQVSGRADLPWEEAIRLDLRYVENWSLSMDLIILARTVTAVLRRSGAY